MLATIHWPWRGYVSTLLVFIKVNWQQQAASSGKMNERLENSVIPKRQTWGNFSIKPEPTKKWLCQAQKCHFEHLRAKWLNAHKINLWTHLLRLALNKNRSHSLDPSSKFTHKLSDWPSDKQSDRVLFESRLQSASTDVLSDFWQLICFGPPTKEITRGKCHQWRGFMEINESMYLIHLLYAAAKF